MSPIEKARRELDACLRQLDASDSYNGGQTVVARYSRGSERRAQIVAEATFWQAEIARLTPASGEAQR